MPPGRSHLWLKPWTARLHGPMLAAFEAHQQTCPSCQAMLQEAQAGMHWLKGLDEAEPPSNLVHNILAQTIGALPSEHIVPAPRGDSWLDKVKARLAPVFAPVATPRFAMSFGMAFFSITMLLGIAGFHLADLRNLRSELTRIYPRLLRDPGESDSLLREYEAGVRNRVASA